MPEVNSPPWVRLVLLVALAKVAVGLGGTLLWPPPDSEGFPSVFYLLYLLSFGGGAALLILGGRQDRRAVALGGFFLVAATAYANRSLGNLEHLAELAKSPWERPLIGLRVLRPDMFLAFFLWLFAREFSQAPVSLRVRRVGHWGVAINAWVAAALFALGVYIFLASIYPLLDPEWLRPFLECYDPGDQAGVAYGFLVPSAFAALGLLAVKARAAAGAEHRRGRFFLFSLCLLLTPLFAVVLIYYVGLAEAFESHPRVKLAVLWACFIPAWTAPVATVYATLVHHVLDFKLIARRALQYALARYSTIALAAVPPAAIAVYIYRHRDSTVADLFRGRPLLLLLAGAILGWAALRYRADLLERIDRRFFREQYDARQILAVVVTRIRATHEVGELAELLCRGIDTALHLESIAMLVEDQRSGAFIDPRSRARRLDAASPLALLVGSAAESLAVDLENPRSVASGLPEADRHWLVDAGFRLIVPIVARDGTLLGLIGLGEKKSSLPYLRDDMRLLHDIASAASAILELEMKHSSLPGPWPDRRPVLPLAVAGAELGEQAKECSNCGTLYLPYMVFCGTCSRKLEVAPVPYVLPGKFRFERRLGVGGMGVVYRAVDLALGRVVAVKTLRRVSPEDAMRLRREARTSASVSHPHLAGIFGVETWQGTPMLILELLEGGTLAHRIEGGPLPALETVELGIAMAGALDRLHAADILHRDIKPSNVGFTKDGVPKLMDFGIARMMWDLRREESGTYGEGDETLSSTSLWNDAATSDTVPRQLVGTLSYLSPEALAGQPPNASFDLWSLALVLFECLLGRKLFAGSNPKQVRARIQLGRLPDLEQTHPDADPVLADFFRGALHRSPARRPATARELRARLETVRAHLAGSS